MMKKLNLALLLVLFVCTLQAQSLGVNVTANIAYISINEEYADNLKRNIDSPKSIRLEENAVSIGVEGSAFYRNVMVGGGIHTFKIKSKRDNRMSLGTNAVYAMAGYNFSRNSRTQLLPSVRVGLMSNSLEIPYVEDETRKFGNTVVKDDSKYKNHSILLGGAITANRHFGNESTGFSIGIGAFYDVGLNGSEWTDGGVAIEGLDLNAYSYYGLCLKLSGGWNQYDDY